MCPVLIDLSTADVPLLLSSFQMKSIEREDVLAICEMINSAKGEQALTEGELDDAFNVRWSDFEKRLPDLLKQPESTANKGPRKDRELLEEILSRVRNLGVLEQEVRQKRLQDE